MTHDWTALLTAATDDFARITGEVGPVAAVPACPGWTVVDLVDHLGGVHQWARHAVVEGNPDGRPVPLSGDPAQWYRRHAADLLAALSDPSGPAWTFGTEQTVAWWLRRQTHETLMHTRDLLEAAGRVDEWRIEPELAWDGVREVATEFYPRQVRLGRTEPIPGTLRLVATDLEVDPVVVGDATPEVELRAPAVGVLLMLWHRAVSDDSEAAALLALPIAP